MDQHQSYEPYDYHRAARHTAERECPAEGLQRLAERLDALHDLAGPLAEVQSLHRRDPGASCTLTPLGAAQLTRLLDTIGHLRDHYGRHAAAVEQAPLAAPGWNAMSRPQAEWRERHMLRCWRSGEETVRRHTPAEKRRQYEAAARVGYRYLQRFTTLEDLRSHYDDDRAPWAPNTGAAASILEPPTGTVEAWAEAARRAAGDGDLMLELVAEAAFWRRACELDPNLPLRDLWEEDGGFADAR